MSNTMVTGKFAAAADCENATERERIIGEIIAGMSLDEKIAQMSGNSNLAKQAVMLARYNYFAFESGENKRLGIPPIRFSDGPRGIVIGNSTCFPVSMARGATWDPELEERVGDVMGIEGRSQGANYYGGVCINAVRHPAGGRSQESFGEDPYHLGEMAVGLIRGVQKHMMACAKHYACNNIENSRFFVSVNVDERTLREIYLPHFKKCVDAGVASFMSAYNRVNGEFCGHNGRLLRDILKKEWKFDGFVMSDFLLGIRSGKLAANGGLDIEMPLTLHYGRRLKKLVAKGDVGMEVIDEAVTRILRQKARFHKGGEPSKYNKNKIACREHAELALEVAQKSIVLLKNEDNALPLKRENIKTIAVIGKVADTINLGDLGSSRVRPTYAVTALQGIRNKAGSSINVVYRDGLNLAETMKAAREADVAIVVVGLSGRDEGEYVPIIPSVLVIGGDRKQLTLSKEHEELIRAVAKENKRCIVVLEGGSAIIVEKWIDDVKAVLMAWYPGLEGGNAIAEIIFGDMNPGGKLPLIFAKSEDQLPAFDNKAKSVEYEYYHGYRLLDKKGFEPRFAFGFGLSYTKYEYKNMKFDKKEIGKSGKIVVSVDITNIGQMAGDEIAQLYVGYNGSKVDRPVKDLKGFAKLALKPGETKTCSIELKAEDLAYWNTASNSWEIEEIEYIAYVGPSSRQKDLLSDTFRVSWT